METMGAAHVKVLPLLARIQASAMLRAQLIEDIEEALGWLDTHFTLTKGEVRRRGDEYTSYPWLEDEGRRLARRVEIS